MRKRFQTQKADVPFVISATLIFALSLLVTAWDFLQLQGAVYHFSAVSMVGLVLFVVGVAIRIVGKKTLGRSYSYGLRTLLDQKLVTHGIYSRVRHPITLAAILYSAGIPIVFSSLFGFLIMLGLIPLFLYRIQIEEQMMIGKFGEEYREYIRRTKKLIPYLY